ncbi:NIPSNAP family protein [Siphonobacter sp. SORGH_AS_0500]|uniref:NIPSNAP family protein n=1 Tax=Siphonobacter sp. SORGH_AS_0500 TaxID=1864824 RepID=UPI001E519490|nr:NIPSNAP family protein [Siphonobacter sp. SORGH_AS_0500]
MRIVLVLLLCLNLTSAFSQSSPAKDSRLYEMRVYYSPEGKQPDLMNRFRNHTMRIFAKHGMTNVGYFVPQHKPDSCLIYFLSYPNRAARDSSWKAFSNDPEWKKVASESEKMVGSFLRLSASSFTPPTFLQP